MSSLENIYISPLELCNLSCLYCYTKKPKTILSNKQILDFVSNYSKALANPKNNFLRALNVDTHSQRKKNSFENLPALQLKSIIFCGGEVFTLPDFPKLVNKLINQNIFITIITNGTIDKLDEIKSPQNCQLIVSFDGPQKIHDQNRGQGNFVKSKKFVIKALSLGFPVEIFYLITKDSYPYKDKLDIFNLHKTYLTDRLGSLTTDQVLEIRNNYPCYPPKDFGCNIFSLQSNGKFYGCCESIRSIGSLSDPLEKTINNYIDIITKYPKCYDPNYHCQLS
jgi:sulfatase maturation enzyme AslB (radical SAM superfamily)